MFRHQMILLMVDRPDPVAGPKDPVRRYVWTRRRE